MMERGMTYKRCDSTAHSADAEALEALREERRRMMRRMVMVTTY